MIRSVTFARVGRDGEKSYTFSHASSIVSFPALVSIRLRLLSSKGGVDFPKLSSISILHT